ncbi:unnamed protein product [Didymodactylos carnosus]|uniref:Damage-inducible protein DinB n=1 Tax=Didymodactylos carnosus TaxID=1234261 RepID=A0A813TBZ1_9BILA|nr:unnamed protein product [Didymodactylos carnosus]CAF0807586.1 unnamed protein product [Didymodactylos carnosus]CAF3535440.1 unnamed protein product [Didymodactylos carnosus]CAF3593098.1 unnamed protein product [Didymodactylos carnosus]
MSYKNHFIRLAIYNRFAFKELFSKLNECISLENYHADSGLFFRSIHGTLCHCLLSSILWYSRIAEPLDIAKKFPFEINSYWSRTAEEWEQVVKDREKLQNMIIEECNRWIDYVTQLEPEQLDKTFKYLDTKNVSSERVRGEALDHIFNHKTHHRGQITAAMTRFGGRDASPVLDLASMPTTEEHKT